MMKNDEDVNNPENQNDTEHVEVFDSVGKVANYSNLRVTELPTCLYPIYPPKPTTITKELHLQNLWEKLMRKVEEYKEKRCLKEIKEKIKNKEMVVFCTDKSNKLAADSIRNYETALNEHTKHDTKGKKRNSW